MTHLSDFSYLQRAVLDVYICVYFVYSVYKNDRFRCLQPSKILSGELRSIITVIMIVMMATQATTDYYSTYIKYSEGFVMLPTGQIVQKPYIMWDPSHQKPVQAMDYLQCVTFAFHTSVFFLMQCFWNYLSNSVAKKSFMGSFEFKFYIVWAIISVAMFPVLQWRWRDDEYLAEIVPQLAYGGEVLITGFLGIRSDFRFRRIIAYSQRNKNSSSNAIVNRLSYFKEMNIILTTNLFVYGSCWVIICADGLTEAKMINTTKFACDLLVANINMCVTFLWLLFISIFHPRREVSSAQSSLISRSGHESEFVSRNDIELTQNSRPMSQRITNFLHTNSSYPGFSESEKYRSPMSPHEIVKASQQSGGAFMRPMSPVRADYPTSVSSSSQQPLSTAGPIINNDYRRNVSVEDPYSSQAVVFSMIEPPLPSGLTSPSAQRFPSPAPTAADRSYHNNSEYRYNDANRGSPLPSTATTNNTQYHDAQSEYDVSEYHDDVTTTTTSTYPNQPSLASRERVRPDWLSQSPERK